jgi:hypothetical protein
MFPFIQPVPSGVPWLDYKEATKTGTKLTFTFRTENFMRMILRNIIVVYPAGASGVSQPQLFAKGNVASSQNLFQPYPLPPELFSSPSQNFVQGALNEEIFNNRYNPVYWHYPLERGDTFLIEITGSPTAILIGCMITGRKVEA